MALSKEQLEERKNYIGGSDAPAVLSLSRWNTPLYVWSVKTGQISEKDISEKLAVKLGSKLEDTVSDLFTEETGKKVYRVNETLYHPKYNFLAANIDRRVIGEKAGFEAKTASGWKVKEWEGEEIPQEYIIQCLHYLAVTGWDRWYIACLIGNQKFVWKVIEREEKIIADIIKKEAHFWNTFVIPKVMPATISALDSDTLYQLYHKVEEGSEVDLGDEAEKIIESIEALQEDEKSLGLQIDQQKNSLKAILKENEVGITKNHKVSWKPQITKRLDIQSLKEENPGIYDKYSKQTESRVLRITQKKEK